MDFQTSYEPIGSLAVEGIIVGVYEDQSTTLDHPVISSNLTIGNFGNTMNKTRLLFDLEGIAAPMILLMKLGKKDEFGGEELRKLVATGARLLRKNGAKTIGVTAFGDARATAEGLSLGLYRLDELKSEVKEEQIETVTLSGNESEIADWNTGVVIADSQNKARRLGELPANIATPSYFVSETEKYFDGMDKVTVTAYDEAWASSQNMGTFLSVAKGSDEPAKFLIVEYRGGTDGEQPLGLVGKGITFDTGGINLKSAAGMYEMRVDCTGAAV
ncbi:MAG: M17 family peptidase N-terminal domain-containing protein, partial [Candidatus Kariarchaeaceae archaeon]